MSELRKTDVVINANAAYMQHLCVTLTSLLENNLQHIGRIFFVTDIIQKEIINRTFSFVLLRFKKEIVYIKFDDPIVNEFKTSPSVPEIAYYRLFLSKLLPSDVDKVLYLDPDVVVNGDISALLKLDFKIRCKTHDSLDGMKTDMQLLHEEFYLYAISEMKWQDPIRLRTIGISHANYFNAGVLLINLKKWRSENIADLLINTTINKKKDLKFYDQDVLNIVFDGRWGEVDYKFNSVNLTLLNQKLSIKDVLIIHYTGETKPWHLKGRHPFKHLYWYYLWKTPYRYYIPEELSFRKIKKRLISFFVPKRKIIHKEVIT